MGRGCDHRRLTSLVERRLGLHQSNEKAGRNNPAGGQPAAPACQALGGEGIKWAQGVPK